jgi:RimJ/RimL family protein N-acetyltransferase
MTRLRDFLASFGLRRPRLLRGARLPSPVDAPRIRTARLELRPHRLDDADDWFALQSEDSVRTFLPWPRRTRRQSAKHLADRTRHTRLWQANDFLALAIVKNGRLIGDVSVHLRQVDAGGRSLEIGWVIHPASGGNGYATEAADALLDFAFDAVGARFVTAVTDPRNVRSTALARRLGFVEVRRDERELVLAVGVETHRERRAVARRTHSR